MRLRTVLGALALLVAAAVGLGVPLAGLVMLAAPADSPARAVAVAVWNGAFAAVHALGGIGWAAALMVAALAALAWRARRASPELRATRMRARARTLLQRRYADDSEGLFLAYRALSATPDENLPKLLEKLRGGAGRGRGGVALDPTSDPTPDPASVSATGAAPGPTPDPVARSRPETGPARRRAETPTVRRRGDRL